MKNLHNQCKPKKTLKYPQHPTAGTWVESTSHGLVKFAQKTFEVVETATFEELNVCPDLPKTVAIWTSREIEPHQWHLGRDGLWKHDLKLINWIDQIHCEGLPSYFHLELDGQKFRFDRQLSKVEMADRTWRETTIGCFGQKLERIPKDNACCEWYRQSAKIRGFNASKVCHTMLCVPVKPRKNVTVTICNLNQMVDDYFTHYQNFEACPE